MRTRHIRGHWGADCHGHVPGFGKSAGQPLLIGQSQVRWIAKRMVRRELAQSTQRHRVAGVAAEDGTPGCKLALDCKRPTPPRRQNFLTPRCARRQVQITMPSGTTPSKPVSDTAWRTENRQPTEYQMHNKWHLMIKYAAYRGARGKKLDTARSTHQGYDKGGWATRAAAIAAKPHFKEWVNSGSSSQQRAAGAASVVARAEAVAAARQRPLVPTRFRGGIRIEAAKVTVGLSIGTTGTVAVALDTVAHASELATEQWHQRAAQIVDRKKRRLDAVDAAAADIPEWRWTDFSERCKKAARLRASEPGSSTVQRPPRGPSHAMRIGQRRHHVSHAARREQQWARQKEHVAAAHAVRVQRIELLRKALLTGNAASLLRAPAREAESEPTAATPPEPLISVPQASRVTTQGWALVCYYEELDRIELGVLDGTCSVPKGGAKLAAAAVGGAFVGVSAGTVRAWAYDFEPEFGSSECGFSRDQRGRWGRPAIPIPLTALTVLTC